MKRILMSVCLVVVTCAAAWAGDPAKKTAAKGTDAMMAEMNIDGLVRSVTVASYAAIAVVGAVVPGLTAWFYARRGGHVRAFREQSPAWVVRALAETA